MLAGGIARLNVSIGSSTGPQPALLPAALITWVIAFVKERPGWAGCQWVGDPGIDWIFCERSTGAVLLGAWPLSGFQLGAGTPLIGTRA